MDRYILNLITNSSSVFQNDKQSLIKDKLSDNILFYSHFFSHVEKHRKELQSISRSNLCVSFVGSRVSEFLLFLFGIDNPNIGKEQLPGLLQSITVKLSWLNFEYQRISSDNILVINSLL
jgi:hypothetical protein